MRDGNMGETLFGLTVEELELRKKEGVDISEIGNDIEVLFGTKCLGVVPNDDAGWISLWSDIVAHHRQLVQNSVIENFTHTGEKCILQSKSAYAIMPIGKSSNKSMRTKKRIPEP